MFPVPSRWRSDYMVMRSELKDTYELIQDGLRGIKREHAAQEAPKVGTLRAGNSGILLPDGQIAGKCARLTYLRFVGVDAEQEDPSREFMFAGGRTNETSWVDLLVSAGVAREDIRQEGEVPISWTTVLGTKVTGRPDIVIGAREPSGTWMPKRGLELKLVSSLWTARDVAIVGNPKAMHLMQAAHYAWKVGVPFELWYTSRADYAINGWAAKQFPKPGQPGSVFCQYNDKGEAMKTLPFVVGYALGWEGQTLTYQRLGPDGPHPVVKTIVTKTGIADYFELVARMGPEEPLPPRPVNLSANGEAGNYSICKYCALSPVCDKKERGSTKAWVEAVKEWQPQLPQVGTFPLDK
jgi:hypothetical protein